MSRAIAVLGLVAGVVGLKLGEQFLVPLCLAGIVCLFLAPLVHLVQRLLRLARFPAVLLTVSLATSAVVGAAWLVATQALAVVEALPQYQRNIGEKIDSLRPMQTRIEEVSQSIEKIAEGETTSEAERPVIEVSAVPAPRRPGTLALLRKYLGPLVGPLATAGLVLILTMFLLVYKESLRDRFVSIVGRTDSALTRQAMDEAASRVSRYLIATLWVNALYGIPVGIGLHLLGVPNAFLWGLLATLLRFIPYVGPWVGALLPVTLAVAVFPGWGRPLQVAGMFVLLELVSNNLVEPYLYGRRTGLSTFAILLAAFFWSWIWGVAGLVVAVPLTLCLAVAGRYVPSLSWLHILLSDDPTVEHHTRIYHRLLAFDVEGAHRMAGEHEKRSGLAALYDDLLIPALRVFEQELYAGTLAPEQAAFLERELRALVLDTGASNGAGTSEDAAPNVSRGLVLCVTSGGGVGEAIATLGLRRSLRSEGHLVEAPPATALVGEAIEQVEEAEPAVVVLFGIQSGGARTQHRVRRLRARFPSLPICATAWGAHSREQAVREMLVAAGANRTAASVAEVTEAVRPLLQSRLARPAESARSGVTL